MKHGHTGKPNQFAEAAASIIAFNECSVEGEKEAFTRLRDAEVLFTQVDKGARTAFTLALWDYFCAAIAELPACCRVDMMAMIESGATEDNVAAWMKLLAVAGLPKRRARECGQ
jgi:hypothetical protein